MPFVNVGGTRLNYVEEGSGHPTVLFLHAFPLSARMWGPQLRGLADRHRLVAVDLKGFGQSDTPDDLAGYTMAGYADEVAGVIEHLGAAPVVVVGLSMGGYVAFALLRRHRPLVSAVVLADTKAVADTPEALDRRTGQQKQVVEGGTGEVIETLLGGLLAESTRRDRPELVEMVRGLMDQPPAGFVGALEAMKQRPDATAELPVIDVPVLVLVGEEDALSPPDGAREMAATMPNAKVEVLPRAGHLSNLEAPEAFNRALGDFLLQL